VTSHGPAGPNRPGRGPAGARRGLRILHPAAAPSYEDTVGVRLVSRNVSRFEWLRGRPKDDTATAPLLMAFDCLYARGKDLRKRPLRVRRKPLAHVGRVDYDSRAMLSRAQEARVREILEGHVPGTLLAYCLEHLAAIAQIPTAHLADLAAFVRNLRACGACQTQFGGVYGSGDYASGYSSRPGGSRRPREARRVS
jgi:hypothetical protein